MSDKSALKNTDSKLRLKLLLGQVLLATIVSAIYVVVAYRLSIDVAERIEVNTNDNLILQLQNAIVFHKEDRKRHRLQKNDADHQHHTKSHHRNDHNTYTEKHNYIYEILDSHLRETFADNLITFKICEKEDCVFWASQAQKTDIKTLFKYIPSTGNSGSLKIQGKRYIWTRPPTNDNFNTTLIRETHIFDTSIEYIIKRLSITSFVTFWIAVWTALIITTISLKRIAKSNTKLRHLATHDTLTGLANRAYLMEELDRVTNQKVDLKSIYKKNLYLLLIDLNKFKDINDSMGHDIGDELLKSVSNRLQKILDKDQKIYRYGGDEFVILMEKSSNRMANRLADKLIFECNQSTNIRGQSFSVGASIGIASFPDDANTPTDLLKCADIAMYQAKKTRKDVVKYILSQKDSEILRTKLRGQIKEALDNHRFILYYQPKMSLPDEKFNSVEALVRWDHPEEGLLTPGIFIDLVEDTGLVHQFCHYVINQALEQIESWRKEGINLSVAVNISPYNILDKNLEELISKKLNSLNIAPHLLELELTESASMIEVETISTVFKQLRKIGIKLSIDDFGTGMSSLAYIKNIGVDTIKIDRSFVTNIANNKTDQIIIHNIITLCHELGYQVVAEGVETKEQLEKLIELHCSYVQGYYFSQPVDPETLVDVYKKSSNPNKDRT